MFSVVILVDLIDLHWLDLLGHEIDTFDHVHALVTHLILINLIGLTLHSMESEFVLLLGLLYHHIILGKLLHQFIHLLLHIRVHSGHLRKLRLPCDGRQ